MTKSDKKSSSNRGNSQSKATAKSSSRKKPASRATKKKKQTRLQLIRRQFHYLPAWVVLGVIVVLFFSSNQGTEVPGVIENELNQSVSVRDEADNTTITAVNDADDNPNSYAGTHNASAPLAPFFADTVMYWEPKINEWALQNNLNPNIVAILMQIESCGHPYAGSGFANGLFQVTPTNFNSIINNNLPTAIGFLEQGSNQLDPDINAASGLYVFAVDCLLFASDDVSAAFACYNGGPTAVNPNNRFQETLFYVEWADGLWADASNGRSTSETMERWFAADNAGGRICEQADRALELLDPLGRNG